MEAAEEVEAIESAEDEREADSAALTMSRRRRRSSIEARSAVAGQVAEAEVEAGADEVEARGAASTRAGPRADW